MHMFFYECLYVCTYVPTYLCMHVVILSMNRAPACQLGPGLQAQGYGQLRPAGRQAGAQLQRQEPRRPPKALAAPGS